MFSNRPSTPQNEAKPTSPGPQFQADLLSPAPLPGNTAGMVQRARRDPNRLSRADLIQLQHTIGNQAVLRLVSKRGQTGGTQSQQSGSVNRQFPAVTALPTPDRNTIQRRIIADTVYKDYDANKTAEATKLLLEVAGWESDVSDWVGQSKKFVDTFSGLLKNEFVAEDAAKKQDSIGQSYKALNETNSVKITEYVDLMLTIYQDSVAKKIYNKFSKGGSIKEKLSAKITAFNNQSKDITDNVKFKEYHTNSKLLHGDSSTKASTIKMDVTSLQKEAETKKNAKQEYTKNKKFYDTEKVGIIEHAAKLNIPSSGDFDDLYLKAEEHAGNSNWIGAQTSSKDYSNKLTGLKSTVTQQQKKIDTAKNDYERIRDQIKVTEKELRKKSNGLSVSWGTDFAQTKSEASDFASQENWISAASKIKECQSHLRDIEQDIEIEIEFADLYKETFDVGSKELSKFNQTQVLKILKKNNIGADADTIRIKLTDYCDAVGAKSNDENFVVKAIETGVTIPQLNSLKGEIAFREFMYKGKTIPEANLIQKANKKFQNLDHDNLLWLVQNNRVIIGRGEAFLMNNLLYLHSAHRKYKLSGTDGVKPKSGVESTIHVHWTNVNGNFTKAHVVPNEATHVNPNPPQNDIPNSVNAIKTALITADCEP